jgi:CheY-like chemotaxis protein
MTKKTILHADDALRWRTYVKTMLGADYKVVSCQDCATALQAVKQGGIDLVIVDQLMPGFEPLGTGLDVCLHLRELFPKLPVILYSGAWFDQEPNRAKLEQESKATVVFKEVHDAQLDDLRGRVRQLIG